MTSDPYHGGLDPLVATGPPPSRVLLGAMPDGPREYHQLLRGPRSRWWRPLVSLALFGVFYGTLMLLVFGLLVLAGAAAGRDHATGWAVREILDVNDLGPVGFVYYDLNLIAIIPAVGLSIWVAHRIRPRFIASVRGGIRWRWLLRCLLVVVPVWVGYLGLNASVTPIGSPRPTHWVMLLVLAVCLTPFQAAGEEYFFRGWIMLNVGSWFSNRVVGLVIGVVVSATLFAAAHNSPDLWVVADLVIFAVTTAVATWRTGGLEAGIVIHAVNNIGVFFVVLTLGGWQHAFVGANTKSTPAAAAASLVAHGIALALILWQARRTGVQQTVRPAPLAPVRPAEWRGGPDSQLTGSDDEPGGGVGRLR